MNAYGTLLKKLIRFTNIKLSNLAEIVGYDTSYISKWCNKDKLPAPKAASHVNRCLADVFAKEIINQEESVLFAKDFKTEATDDENQLISNVYHLLKAAYKESYDTVCDHNRAAMPSQSRLLLWQPDIRVFMNTELPQLIEQLDAPCEILCTMDICTLLPEFIHECHHPKKPKHPIHLKMGLSLERQNKDPNYISQLYYLMNQYNFINFDFFDNSAMDLMNILVIKDCAAVQCSMDKYSRINIASVITDIKQVNTIYQRIASEFTPNYLLIHSSNSDELFFNGYRTEFYSHNTFQILLTRGFEFLLPPEINARLIQVSTEQGFDNNMGQLIASLGITWEEIFEKGCIDFYLLKTRLMQYINDGIIYFTDVVYHMSVEERKRHIEYILEVIQKNPNIRFFIIDDEFIPNAAELFQISVYNNKKKLFLKDTSRHNNPDGPNFYTVQNDILIHDVSQYLESLQDSPFCCAYKTEDVLRFYDKYGTMIYRMLSLGKTTE